MNPRLHGAPPSSVAQPEPGYRPDILSFLSEALTEPLTIAGNIRVRLYVASDAADTSFTVKLMELRPDGKAYNIEDGIATLAFRAGIGKPVAYEPGTIVSLDLELWPIDWKIAAGSRLRLDLSSSNFPAYHAHPNRFGPWAEVAEAVVAHQTLHTGGDCASYVELPANRGIQIFRS
jgi:putative CocE/NonD family hydrolase